MKLSYENVIYQLQMHDPMTWGIIQCALQELVSYRRPQVWKRNVIVSVVAQEP